MANVIQVKRNVYTGTGDPAAANLAYGELGWNNANGSETAGKLWVGQQTGTDPVVIAPKLINKPVLGTTNEVTVTEAAGSFTVGLPDDVTIGGDFAVTGDLTVNGPTTTVNSTTLTVDDPILTLGGDAAPTADDDKDRGIEFRYHDGTSAKLGFFGWDDSASTHDFVFYKAATNTSEVFSGTVGTIKANLLGDVTGGVSGNAGTATTLATARNIGGVSFNGSANIDLPGVNSGGDQDTSGNAATATILATARNIGGVAFDGSANIDLPGVNSAGNQNTSGEAATLASSFVIDGGTYS